MQDFRRLRVWHAAHRLYLWVIAAIPEQSYRKAAHLRDQIVDAARSVHANIAEGCGKDSNRDYDRFLGISCSSLNEVEADLYSARDLGLISPERFGKLRQQVTAVRKMLLSLRRTVQARIAREESQRRRNRQGERALGLGPPDPG